MSRQLYSAHVLQGAKRACPSRPGNAGAWRALLAELSR